MASPYPSGSGGSSGSSSAASLVSPPQTEARRGPVDHHDDAGHTPHHHTTTTAAALDAHSLLDELGEVRRKVEREQLREGQLISRMTEMMAVSGGSEKASLKKTTDVYIDKCCSYLSEDSTHGPFESSLQSRIPHSNHKQEAKLVVTTSTPQRDTHPSSVSSSSSSKIATSSSGRRTVDAKTAWGAYRIAELEHKLARGEEKLQEEKKRRVAAENHALEVESELNRLHELFSQQLAHAMSSLVHDSSRDIPTDDGTPMNPSHLARGGPPQQHDTLVGVSKLSVSRGDDEERSSSSRCNDDELAGQEAQRRTNNTPSPLPRNPSTFSTGRHRENGSRQSVHNDQHTTESLASIARASYRDFRAVQDARSNVRARNAAALRKEHTLSTLFDESVISSSSPTTTPQRREGTQPTAAFLREGSGSTPNNFPNRRSTAMKRYCAVDGSPQYKTHRSAAYMVMAEEEDEEEVERRQKLKDLLITESTNKLLRLADEELGAHRSSLMLDTTSQSGEDDEQLNGRYLERALF